MRFNSECLQSQTPPRPRIPAKAIVCLNWKLLILMLWHFFCNKSCVASPVVRPIRSLLVRLLGRKNRTRTVCPSHARTFQIQMWCRCMKKAKPSKKKRRPPACLFRIIVPAKMHKPVKLIRIRLRHSSNPCERAETVSGPLSSSLANNYTNVLLWWAKKGMRARKR